MNSCRTAPADCVASSPCLHPWVNQMPREQLLWFDQLVKAAARKWEMALSKQRFPNCLQSKGSSAQPTTASGPMYGFRIQ
jgi:hypothetical protein